jgi:hypothetical protein
MRKPAFQAGPAALGSTQLTEMDMRGHIIAEERFRHMGIDHHLFVTGIEQLEHEYRFEVTCIPPGGDEPKTVFEKLVNFSDELAQCPGTTIDQLINAELTSVRNAVNSDEDLHTHDP